MCCFNYLFAYLKASEEIWVDVNSEGENHTLSTSVTACVTLGSSDYCIFAVMEIFVSSV